MKCSRCVLAVLISFWFVAGIAGAAPLPGGTLDPLAIPKYVTPLVIPPVMDHITTGPRKGANNYDIAVRQFQQQILPGGIWKALGFTAADFPATTVWSYGPAKDPLPDANGLGLAAGVAPAPNSQFNYPAYTVETNSGTPVNVRWINDLKDTDGNFLPHLLPVDQTLHWANPPATGCMMGDPDRTDCATGRPEPYTGPVPIVTHVHGAHVDPHSDGYPEAWWLPAANDIPAEYARKGGLFDDSTGANPGNHGYADFRYRNDQPATTLWYHDHTLGMTRSNVYAGPAGFWLIRGGENDKVDNIRTRSRFLKWDGVLPGPAPKAGDTVLELNAPGVSGAIDVRSSIREIPIVIQDRSFNADGSLFYPDNRAFFQGLNFTGHPTQFPDAGALDIDFIPNSDIPPIWNPEAFFNVMVVNGVSWPTLDVAPALYRLRLLNGCNSRFLNLSMKIISSPLKALVGRELSFFQIGAEQGFLPKVVEIRTGFATPLPGDGMFPRPAGRLPNVPGQALLMGLAERADVLVDFRFLPPGTVVQLYNTGPDEPFGGGTPCPPGQNPVDNPGCGDFGPADPGTTGQVMQFVVKWDMFKLRDLFTTDPWVLRLNSEGALGAPVVTRQVSLNETASDVVCAEIDAAGNVVQVPGSTPPLCALGGEPFAPKEALLGTVDLTDPAVPAGIPLMWTDETGISTPTPVTMANGVTVKFVNVTENPALGDTETWELHNFTEDAHPIHLHLVRFEVVGREIIGGGTSITGSNGPQPWEAGYKDTVIAYPGEITRVKAKFDIPGLYVWHCHIVEHEDNEMMRPYIVSGP